MFSCWLPSHNMYADMYLRTSAWLMPFFTMLCWAKWTTKVSLCSFLSTKLHTSSACSSPTWSFTLFWVYMYSTFVRPARSGSGSKFAISSTGMTSPNFKLRRYPETAHRSQNNQHRSSIGSSAAKRSNSAVVLTMIVAADAAGGRRMQKAARGRWLTVFKPAVH